jgi:hypothetical protein
MVCSFFLYVEKRSTALPSEISRKLIAHAHTSRSAVLVGDTYGVFQATVNSRAREMLRCPDG